MMHQLNCGCHLTRLCFAHRSLTSIGSIIWQCWIRNKFIQMTLFTVLKVTLESVIEIIFQIPYFFLTHVNQAGFSSLINFDLFVL